MDNVPLELVREFCQFADQINWRVTSLGDAAKNMHVAKSTLSKHLTSLEASAGCKLVERERTGHLALTPTGEILYMGNRQVNTNSASKQNG